MVVKLFDGTNEFAEDKEAARSDRMNRIMPALDRKKKVVLDFGKIEYSTQSFVHALIGEAIQKHGEDVLERIEFRNCSSQVKSLIELVVDYSLGGFQTE